MENEKVEVTQADRDAAADMWRATGGDPHVCDWQAEWMESGTADFGPVVQAFATYRHRIEATRPQAVPREPTAKMVEAGADAVETWVNSRTGVDTNALGMIWRAMYDATPSRPQAEGRQGVEEIVERLNNFVTCGCDDGEWCALRADTVALIERLSAEREDGL